MPHLKTTCCRMNSTIFLNPPRRNQKKNRRTATSARSFGGVPPSITPDLIQLDGGHLADRRKNLALPTRADPISNTGGGRGGRREIEVARVGSPFAFSQCPSQLRQVGSQRRRVREGVFPANFARANGWSRRVWSVQYDRPLFGILGLFSICPHSVFFLNISEFLTACEIVGGNIFLFNCHNV